MLLVYFFASFTFYTILCSFHSFFSYYLDGAFLAQMGIILWQCYNFITYYAALHFLCNFLFLLTYPQTDIPLTDLTFASFFGPSFFLSFLPYVMEFHLHSVAFFLSPILVKYIDSILFFFIYYFLWSYGRAAHYLRTIGNFFICFLRLFMMLRLVPQIFFSFILGI